LQDIQIRLSYRGTLNPRTKHFEGWKINYSGEKGAGAQR